MRRAGRSPLLGFAVPALSLLLLSARVSAGGGAPAAPAAASSGVKAGAKAASPADKRAAQKLLAQGNQLLGEGDYVGALDKFRAAYDKFPSPKLLLNIGTTLRQLGRNVEAAEVYEAYLSDPEHDKSREKEVRRVLDEIDAVVGRIVITLDDAAATVRLDGKPIEGFKSGESRRIDVGEHTVIADKAGASPVVENVVVRARQEHHVTLRFAPPPPPVVKPAPDPNTGVQRKLGLVLGGVGAATIIAGAVMGFVALAQSGDAAGHCYMSGKACDVKGIELDQSAKTSATISTIGFAVGTGILGAGALIFLLSPAAPKDQGPSSPAAWLSVAPQVGGAGVVIGGVF